jgi:hypothetical protein
MEKMRMESGDKIAENVRKIAELFPHCVTESIDMEGHKRLSIHFDALRQSLQEDLVQGEEAYEFTWVGKKQAIVDANKSIRKTLRPCREKSIQWENTENLYIEGDNLEVLKLLQESYLNSVKMIYIDPPYNTGNDFIYRDNFTTDRKDYLENSGVIDAEGKRLFKNTDTNGRFHSDWCSMIYARLYLARNLLADDGLIFISIGEHEVDSLKKICAEVFGADNFIENYIWESTFRPDNSSKIMRRNAEYVMCFAKNIYKITALIGEVKAKEGLPSLTKASMKESILTFPANRVITYLPDGKYKAGARDSYTLLNDVEVKDGKICTKFSLQGHMIWGQENLEREMANGTEIIIKGEGFVPYTKKQGDSVMAPAKIIPNTIVGDVLSANAEFSKLFAKKVFSYPKPVSLLEYLIKYFTDKDFLVLDFFSGSSTTAHAVMRANAQDGGSRKFIMVQLAEDLDENYKIASEKERVVIQNALELCEEKKLEHTICSVAQERISRAAASLAEEYSDAQFDSGFRVLKLDDSNMKEVYYSAGDYSQEMLSKLESNIKSDRSDLDLLFGCLLEWGLPLSLPYSEEQIEGCTVHNYNQGDLIACFNENIPESVIKEIAKKKPLRAVFRDSSFAGSPEKINVGEIFKLMAPDTRVKVI